MRSNKGKIKKANEECIYFSDVLFIVFFTIGAARVDRNNKFMKRKRRKKEKKKRKKKIVAVTNGEIKHNTLKVDVLKKLTFHKLSNHVISANDLNCTANSY